MPLVDLAACAVLGFLSYVLYLSANRYLLASYCIAIKRASSSFSVVFGFLFFAERQLKRRLAASLVMVAGVCCIVVG